MSRVYLLWKDPEEFHLQEEEVEEVRWIDYDDCIRAVRENHFPHCIAMEELKILEGAVRAGRPEA